MSRIIFGGCGSLGTALVRYATSRPFASLTVFDNDEYAVWRCQQEFPDVKYILGDVRDAEAVGYALHEVNTIINCAAMKQVPVCEDNPEEAVKTNILGAINIVHEARKHGIRKAIHISTDKAVEPTTLYGATKMVAENIFLRRGYSVMRLVNLRHSRGNFLERWAGCNGDIPVTDERMGRYFMEQEEIAKFVWDNIANIGKREILIPKCQEESILDIAKSLYPDRKVVITGIRKGEKLHEKLFAEGEQPVDCGAYWKVVA